MSEPTAPIRDADASIATRAMAWVVPGLVVAALALVPLAAAWRLAPDLGHGWAAPILIAYLWWERRAERPRVAGLAARDGATTGLWLFLVLALACAFPLRLLLTPYPLWPMALLAYLALLAAIALTCAHRLAGWAGVAWLGGPLLILLGALPWPGALDRALILPLREGLAQLVAELNNLLGRPALAGGTSVRMVGGWVGIDEACGGMRSLQASITAALFFGEWLRFGVRRRVVLLLAAAGAAVLGNFLRVLALSWCAGSGPEALERWHDPAGWTALGLSLALTGGAASLLRGRSEPRPIDPGAAGAIPPPKNVFKKPIHLPGLFRWSVAAATGLAAIDVGTRLWYASGAARDVGESARWVARLPAAAPGYAARPLADSARETLRPDGYESGAWRGADGRERGAYYVEWRRGQVARSVPFLHNPTVCLPYTGCELVEELGEFTVMWAGGEIPFRAYVFHYLNQEMTVAFTIWDTARGQALRQGEGEAAGWWRSQWRDVREARRHQPAQLLSFTIAERENLDRMAAEIAALVAAE